jgi:predicted DNA-binding transcriptional regulator AlpA
MTIDDISAEKHMASSWIYLRLRVGEFPAPWLRDGRVVRWLRADVDKFFADWAAATGSNAMLERARKARAVATANRAARAEAKRVAEDKQLAAAAGNAQGVV